MAEAWPMVGMSSAGSWLVFGVILLPVYGMLLGWFLGRPRNFPVALMGLGYVVGIVVLMWAGLAVFAELLRVVFY